MPTNGSASPPSGPALYHEEQRFRQGWVWFLVAGAAALTWWIFVRQILLGRQFGDNPAPEWSVWLIWFFIGLGLPSFFLYLKLLLDVTSDQIVIRFRPLARRVIPLAEIEALRVRKYNAVKEYGGWGIKGWSKSKVAYNVSGNEGVELALRDGRRVMLGSQRAQELADAIEGQLAGRRGSGR